MRVDGGIAGRDVHDLANACLRCRADQGPRVGNGFAEAHAAATEPDPVRVVEDVGAAQAFDQGGAVGELQRCYLGVDVLSLRPMRVIRQGSDAAFLREQAAGNVPAGKAECTCDDVEPLLVQNGNRVKPYASEPGLTCPEVTTRGRCRIASAGNT